MIGNFRDVACVDYNFVMNM
ncbi:Protein of unknown function [Bacillus mycoides]|nr:Protein of unknown function [Bacillus mycoides]